MTPLKVTEAEDRLCAMWGTFRSQEGRRGDGDGLGRPVRTEAPGRGAAATHRWEREVRSLKEPSGRLAMSLPWRVLKRKHRSGQ